MNDSPSTPPAPDGAQLSDLLRDVDWLRRLARRLASSDVEADDIAQRTWLAALRRRPEVRGATIRPWLAQVLRNEARMERRSKRRRLERETLVAAEASEQGRPPADELASELEERFRLQQRLMAAVAGLDQPYRSSVLATYFEGLSAADLAARDDVSIRTVESRLRRGREALRQKLDAHFGAREAWAALALPLLPLGGPIAPPRAADPSTSVSPSLVSKTLKTGATAVTIKSAWIGAAALVALVLAWQLSLDVEPLAAQGSEVAILDAELATALETPLPAAEPSGDRVTAQQDVPKPVTVDAKDSGEEVVLREVTIRARVFDSFGDPWVGQWVRLDPPLGEVDRHRTGVDGRLEFRAELPESFRSELVPESGEWTTVMSRPTSEEIVEGNMVALLAVAPSTELRAEVVDQDGDPIEGAEATIALPEGFRFRFDDTLNMSQETEWSGTSDAHGALVVDAAPVIDGCSLELSAPGFRSATVERPSALESAGGVEPLVIVLERLSYRESVNGVVLGSEGEPIEGARVGLGHACRTTGADGKFSFNLNGEDGVDKGNRRIVAAAKGHSPSEFEPVSVDGAASWPDRVELRLEESVYQIEGVVLGRDGQPLPKAKVWIDDPTFVGIEGHQKIVAEGLAGEWPKLWLEATADAKGRFMIDHLGPRTYSIQAMDPRTLLLSELVPVEAGATNARIPLSGDVEVADLEGVVRSASGEPLEGASISCYRYAFMYSAPGARGATVERADTDAVVSGVDGRFRLEDVPISEGNTLQVTLAHHSPLIKGVEELEGPLDDLEITLYASCQARVVDQSREGERADWVAPLDADGNPVGTTYLASNKSANMGEGVPITDGNSPTFWVSNAATTLVFSRDGESLYTMPVALRPGEVNELVRP